GGAATSCNRDLIDDADDDRADRDDVAHLQDLAHAVALGEHDDLVADAGLDVIDGDEARAGVHAVLVDRLHHEQRAARIRRMLHGGPHRGDHAAALHRPMPSTMPTIAASTGTKCGSHASSASREPTRYTRSPGPACTRSI